MLITRGTQLLDYTFGQLIPYKDDSDKLGLVNPEIVVVKLLVEKPWASYSSLHKPAGPIPSGS